MHHPHCARALRRLHPLTALLALTLTGCIVENTNTETERDGGGGAGAAGGAGGAGAEGGAGGAIGGSGGEGGTVECAAEPTCPPDRTQVAQCPADSNCLEVTLCGSTIGCLFAGPCYDDVAACNEDEVMIPFCPFEAERVGLCRALDEDCSPGVYCAADTSCRAIPTCPEGTTEADDCAPGDPTCHWELLCNSVIACRPTDSCTCLPGTFPIDGLCAPGDAFCLPRVGCSSDSAQPPACMRDACGQRADLDLCPEGHRNVPACADNGHPCTEGIACGEPYACESPVSCLNPCPEGIAQVPACSGDDQYTCIEVPECGAFCEGPAE